MIVLKTDALFSGVFFFIFLYAISFMTHSLRAFCRPIAVVGGWLPQQDPGSHDRRFCKDV